MIHAELLSETDLVSGKHVYIFSDAEGIEQISGRLKVSDLLNCEEVGFFGANSTSLHDQLDDFIGDGQDGDPLTQVFSDLENLKEYLIEHSDMGVDCTLLCDGPSYFSTVESFVASLSS